jgi:hypothetical protein
MDYTKYKKAELIRIVEARDKSLAWQAEKSEIYLLESSFLKGRTLWQRIVDVQYKACRM